MVVLVVAALLVSIAVPAYDQYVDRARESKAVADIAMINMEINKFLLRNNTVYPDSLNELGVDIPLDPWDQPYVYFNVESAGPGNGQFRKDGNLNPINTDFDLYSLGEDGRSAGPLNAKHSRDDIVRANNGAFIGKAEDY